MALDASLLNTQHYKVRVKWSNPGKSVAPSPTPRCSSYWKESLLVALDYGRQLYLLILIIVVWKINIHNDESFLLVNFLSFLSELDFEGYLLQIMNMKKKGCVSFFWLGSSLFTVSLKHMPILIEHGMKDLLVIWEYSSGFRSSVVSIQILIINKVEDVHP